MVHLGRNEKVYELCREKEKHRRVEARGIREARQDQIAVRGIWPYFKLGGDSGKEVFCRFRRHKGYRFDSWIGTHSSILAQRITWTEETGGLQFIVSQREHTAHKYDEKSLEGSGPGELELIQNLIGLFYLLHGIETRGIKGRSSVQ